MTHDITMIELPGALQEMTHMSNNAGAANLTSAAAGAPATEAPVGATTNLCSTPPRRTIPILFVPGVMGSPLHFKAITQRRELDGMSGKYRIWRWIRVSAERARTELRLNTPARVMTDIDDPIESAHGSGGVIGSFDLGFQRFWRGEGANQGFRCGIAAPVYAIGYDWRQSNDLSPART